MKYDIEILISKLFNGDISEKENNILIAWYNQSEENKIRFAELLSIRQAASPVFNLNEINVFRAEKELWKKISDKPVNNSFRKIRMLWQKIAVILFIPLLFLSLYLWNNNRLLQMPKKVMREVTALPGTRTKVSLPDGSLVWINSGSILSYFEPFDTKERKTILKGEGYFSVQADKKHPFIVSINGLDVRVTGTELNIESYPDDTLTTVALIEGKAEILLPNGKAVTMQPANKLILDRQTQHYILRQINPAFAGKWKEGVLIFRDEPLSDVFKRIGRTFNISIRLQDADLGNQLYRATFTDESLQQILDLLKQTAPIDYKYITENGEEILVVSFLKRAYYSR